MRGALVAGLCVGGVLGFGVSGCANSNGRSSTKGYLPKYDHGAIVFGN